MNDDISLYIPFSKKDEEQRLVYGYASTEAVDSQGEIVEKKAIEEALPDYMRFANIREMHQPSAVGKAKSAQIDKKGLFLSAKIVDDNAWKKVQEGVYNGFSIGGRKVMTMANRIKKLLLSEISIVDRPANPEALFTLVKFDKAGNAVDSVPAVEATEKPDPQREELYNMFDAAYILGMAKELAYMMMQYKTMKKPTKDLENAIKNLKSAAKDNLGKLDFDVVDGLFKAVLSSKERGDLSSSSFAYIDGNGGKHLPIQDEAHVRNAIARFGQTQFESQDAKRKAAKKIISAAKRHGIKFSNGSEVAQAAGEKSASISIWFNEWENQYFHDLRKVLG